MTNFNFRIPSSRRWRNFCCLLLVFVPFLGKGQLGQVLLKNLPPQAYQSKQYSSSPQNFGVGQDGRGVLYLGNASGVLTWDGKHWEMVKATENQRMFKFANDRQGRVYTGGLAELGFFDADSTGQTVFRSLKKKLPTEVQGFEQISRVASQGNNIFFLGGPFLFVWNGTKFQVWERPNGFKRVFTNPEKVFISDADGLYQLKADSLRSISLPDFISPENIRAVIPLSPTSLLIATYRRGLYLTSPQGTHSFQPALDSLAIFNGVRLPNGDIALATNGQGLYILAPDGQVRLHIDERSGLQQNQVVLPVLGKQADIWLPLFSGLAHLEYPSPLSMFGKAEGLNEIVLCAKNWGGHLFFGSTNGLYRFENKAAPLGNQSLLPVEVGGAEVLALVPDGDQLLVCASKGIFAVDQKLNSRLLLPLPALNFALPSKNNPKRIFLAMADRTVRSIYKDQGKWRPETTVATLPHHVKHLLEAPDHQLWAAYEGISSIEMLPQGDTTVTTLDSSHGLTAEMRLLELSSIGQDLAVGSETGVYRWDASASQLVPDSIFAAAFGGQAYSAYNLTETQSGDVWITAGFTTGLLRKQSTGQFVYDSLPIVRAPVSDVFSIYEDSDATVWLGGTEALVRYNPQVSKSVAQPFHALIRRVTANNDTTLFFGNHRTVKGAPSLQQSAVQVPRLPYQLNHLTFDCAAPFFEAPDKTQYRHRLLGQAEKWSPWSGKTECEFTNLHEGKYLFQFEAQNVYGIRSSTAEYRFQVYPPWYRSLWAYFAYGLLGLLGVLAVVRVRTGTLRAAKRRLEGVVAARTEEIQSQMVQLKAQKSEISAEKEKSDQLLLNILPRETSEELKAHGSSAPQQFESVTILFTDFKGFTQIAEQLSPKELVDEIHHCFSAFDRIAERNGIEKIKTIGDAYMAAGGLPTSNSTHALDVVRTALEIRDFMVAYQAERQRAGGLAFEVRLGVHTGPVVAGIVGLNKFQYDIWGDAVNTAARMESSGVVGKVNISETTFQLVKDHFWAFPRGKIMAKHKGMVDMYFVEWMRE